MVQGQLLPEALPGDPGAGQELLLAHQACNLDGKACMVPLVALQHWGNQRQLSHKHANTDCPTLVSSTNMGCTANMLPSSDAQIQD